LIFSDISKFWLWADFEKFWQFWTILGRFGQNLLHWQWLTTCPKITWYLKNLITFEP
jgi:hypothetical protein